MAAHLCIGKREYADFPTARRMAKRTNDDRDGARVQPYRCRLCSCWHVGHTDTPGKRRRPRQEIDQ